MFVYAQRRKVDSYLWLAQRGGFDVLPSRGVAAGRVALVMEVQLDEQRKLPFEDTEQVLGHLRTQGWHLQLPPQKPWPPPIIDYALSAERPRND